MLGSRVGRGEVLGSVEAFGSLSKLGSFSLTFALRSGYE